MQTELSAVAASLADQIDRPVAIDDPTMRLLTHTPHHGPVDPVRMQSILHLRAHREPVQWVLQFLAAEGGDVVRTPWNEQWSLLPRVCAPLRHEGRLYGYLWVTDPDESLTEAELELITQGARAAARVLADQGLPRTAATTWERSLVQDLLDEDEETRRAAARALVSSRSQKSPITVVTLDTGRGAQDAPDLAYLALGRLTHRFPDHPLLALVVEEHAVLVVPQTPPDVTTQIAEAARAELAQVLRREVRSSSGAQVGSLLDAVHSYRQAMFTLTVLQRGSANDSHLRWEDLGLERMLLHVPAEVPLRDLVPSRLWPLLNDPAAEDLVNTVSVYLDHAGDVQSSVAELHVHRTSLYYRLKRFEDLSGLNMHDGRDRLAVHAAFTLIRQRGWRPVQDRSNQDLDDRRESS